MNVPLKIGCYCSSVSWGGLEMNLLRHAKWMHERGNSVHVFGVEGSRFHQEAVKCGLSFTIVTRNKKYLDFSCARKLARQFVQLDLKFIWIRDVRDMSTIGLAKKLSGNRFKLIYQQAMQLGVSKKDWIHTKRFSRIDLWIAPLHYLANQVSSHTRFPKERISIIPLGIDVHRFDKVFQKEESRNQLQIDQGIFTLGILGRIDPKKGQLLVVKAIIEERKRGNKINLLIVGEKTAGEADEYHNEIQGLIESEGAQSYIYLRPYMEEVGIFYGAIDGFVMASEGETFGMVTLESLLFGVPIIGTDSAGTSELLDNGKHGQLFVPNDLDALTNCIIELYNNQEKYKLIANEAKNQTRAKFDSKYVSDQLEKAFLLL